ncbi:probable serine/threonine-protein kinase PIX13 [Euphorbia lathyris]|uniref:probable serine/threonine-protein kinase PIX13 n=1 Tax=Euphorbia lathyris TaxID=212925 RepID=UPI003313E84F
MGNCWFSPSDELDADPLPIPATTDQFNPDISSICESTCQIEASTNITWPSQVSSTTSTFGKNLITSQKISYDAGNNLRVFTFEQLKIATHNFRRDRVVGRGGFGKVYKGGLKEKLPSQPPHKLIFAVKKLDASSKQGLREWLSEVNILGSLSHPNLVKLLGYSTEEGMFFLIYEFMPNGTLNYHLFGKGSVRPLPWDIRFQIALGMARGLAYLHTGDVPIVHRDFKSSNVLLDKLYNAKIADFGLASLAGKAYSGSGIAGTVGYMPPEVLSTGRFSVKSDVYGFGTVIVEMLTGLRAVDRKRPIEQMVLVSWVKPYLSNKRMLKSIMDCRLEGKYPYKEASQIAMLALKCLNDEPRLRPPMEEIIDTLQQLEACQNTRVRQAEID